MNREEKIARIKMLVEQRKKPVGNDPTLMKTALDQGLQGATFGFADEITDRMGAGIAYGAGKLGVIPEQPLSELLSEARETTQADLDRQMSERPEISIPAQLAGGMLTGGALASTKAANAGVNLLRQSPLATRMLAGSGLSQAGFSAYEAGTAEDGEKLDAAAKLDPLALGVGAAFPLAGAGINKIRSGLTPKAAEYADDVIKLSEKYEVPIGLDDVTDSKLYERMIEQGKNTVYSNADKFTADAQKKFNKAVAKTIGMDADRLTPDVLNKFYKEIGDEFDGFTKGKTFSLTPEFEDRMLSIKDQVDKASYGEQMTRAFKKFEKQVRNSFDADGNIDGDVLKKLRQDLRADSARGAQGKMDLASDLEDAVVDLISDYDPSVSEAFRDVKYRYKNFKVIQDIAIKNQIKGDINPTLLKNRVKAVYGQNSTSTGNAGELGELAMLGEAMKSTLADSGTAANASVAPLVGQGGLLNSFKAMGQYVNPMTMVNRGRIARNFDQDYIKKIAQNPMLARSVIAAPAVEAGRISGMIGGQ